LLAEHRRRQAEGLSEQARLRHGNRLAKPQQVREKLRDVAVLDPLADVVNRPERLEQP
jgi:hypothetical protein